MTRTISANRGPDPCDATANRAARDGFLVVMTACIDPGSNSHQVNRADPQIRLADYRQALEFWLKHKDARLRRILFIDNSNYPLDTLRQFAAEHNPFGKETEFISLDCNYPPPGLGYGYSEFAMLDLGLPASRLAAKSRFWIKATGRLRFDGVTKLLNRLPGDFRFAVDCRENRWFVKWPQFHTTTQFMVFDADFYEQTLIGVKDDMTGRCIEDFVYARLIRFRGEPGAMLRWPVNVTPVGISGGQKNYRSPKQRVLNLARAVLRRVAPNWWV